MTYFGDPRRNLGSRQVAALATSRLGRLDLHGVATDQIEYLTADGEPLIIAQASAKLDDDGRFTESRILVRRKGTSEVDQVRRTRVEYMDVSPRQTVSVATAMIRSWSTTKLLCC